MENQNDNLKKKTTELKLLVEKYQKELDIARDDCKHKDKKVKLIIEPGSSGNLRLVCQTCGKQVGYPSKLESDDFYENNL